MADSNREAEKSQLRSLLQEALAPETAKTASDAIRQLLQQPQGPQKRTVFLLLAEEALQGEKDELRQLAAVLLRRKISTAFGCMNPSEQEAFTESLVGRLGTERCNPVRRSLSHLLASVLRLPEFGVDKTKHVLQLLAAPILHPQQQAQEPGQLKLQQVATVEVFTAYVENAADGKQPFFDELVHIFQQALVLSTETSQLAGPALKGLRALAEEECEVEAQKKLFALLPGVTSVIERSLEANDDAAAVSGLELIDDLLCNEEVLTDGELLQVLNFLLRIASATSVDIGIRQQAMAPIHWAARQKPRVLCKGGFVPRLLDVLVEMAAEPDDASGGVDVSDLNVDDEGEDLTPQRLACQTVDAISVALPNKHVCRPLLQKLEPYIRPTMQRTPEQEVLQQRAALMCIGIMSEGCEAAMRSKLKTFMPFLLQQLQHTHPAVVAAAALCLGQFAEYLQPDIMAYQQQALPLLLAQLDNASRLAQHKACYALDVLLENMEAEDVAPVAVQVVQKLVATLQQTPSDSVREVCLSAIRSAAVACVPADSAEDASGTQSSAAQSVSGATARPLDAFAPDLFRLLEEIVRSPTKLRGSGAAAARSAAASNGCSPATKARAIGVIGGLIKGLSPQCYKPQLQGLLHLVLQQVDGEGGGIGGAENSECQAEAAHEIRDEAFACFRDVSATLKEEFVPFLEDVMVRLLASLFSTEGLVESDQTEFPLGDGEDESEMGVGRDWHIREGYLDELDSAALCLRSLWENCGGHCMKYLQKTTEAIEVLKTHFHEPARQQACFLIAAVLTAALKTLVPPQQRAEVTPLPPSVLLLWKSTLYPLLFSLIQDDGDKETVADAFSAMGSILEEVGAGAIYSEEQCKELFEACSEVLRGKHTCQLRQDVDEVRALCQDDDSRQEEEYLFEGLVVFLSGFAGASAKASAAASSGRATDSAVASAIAQCNMEVFTASYAQLHPHMLALASHKHSTAYAAIGLGCFAEVFRQMKGAAVVYAESPQLLNAVARGISQDDDEDYRRNACFCLSVIYEVAGKSPGVSGRTMEFLQLLHPVFKPREDLNKSEHITMDNAAAAVAAMLTNAPSNVVPTAQLLPFFLKALPLQGDHEESKGILKACLHVANTHPDLVLQNAQQFILVCICEASFPGNAKLIGTELQEAVKQLLQSLLRNPALPANTLSGLVEALQLKPYALAFLREVSGGCGI